LEGANLQCGIIVESGNPLHVVVVIGVVIGGFDGGALQRAMLSLEVEVWLALAGVSGLRLVLLAAGCSSKSLGFGPMPLGPGTFWAKAPVQYRGTIYPA
jgi:hypothetical protein